MSKYLTSEMKEKPNKFDITTENNKQNSEL